MNYGPLLFLAAFFALASSWSGLVMAPQLQIGRLQQTNTVGGTTVAYPVARPGLAQQGLEVYRANGCAYCHSQQVGQTGTVVDVALTDAGTNLSATVAALLKLADAASSQPAALTPLPALEMGESKSAGTNLLSGLPKAFLRCSSPKKAAEAVKVLDATSAKAQLWIVPVGPDIARGWGRRRTVAEDFLFDSTVLPGSQRVGPDLADVGTRLPDVKWHLLHLYAPQIHVKGSTMPPYRFLFEKHKIDRYPSPEALVLPPEVPVERGYEIVPKPAARSLAAYLVSLRADAPLFVAPITVATAAATSPTNALAGSAATATNAAPNNAPPK
jgi:cbb3-type cytochrome oxidase cytochrome c subunit